jgi:hypothetical protein
MDTSNKKKEAEDEQNGACSIFCISLFQLALQALIGYLAYSVSTKPKYFGDPEECLYLRTWTYRHSILIFYVMGWDVICLTLIIIGTIFTVQKLIQTLRTFNNILYPFIFLLYIASFISMTVSYLYWEECGKCRFFVTIILIIFWTSVLMFFSYLGCSSHFFWYAIKDLYERRFGHHSANNQEHSTEYKTLVI